MRQIVLLIKVFVVWTLVGLLGKVFFLLFYNSLMADCGFGDCLAVVWHGLRLDVAVAGYLSIIPGLVLIVSLWYGGRPLRWIWSGYFLVTAVLYSLAHVSNLALYSYWGFPLDSTPLLYIRTSPADALASMTAMEMVVMPVAIAAVAAAVFLIFHRLFSKHTGLCNGDIGRRSVFSAVLLALTASMLIPIRGGFGTGTNHTGSVYFSSDMRTNHAAVNPVFSFIESALHQEDIATRYRYMTDKEASAIFGRMTCTRLRPDAVRNDYNVLLICLESFSKYIMGEAGHVNGVTPSLDRYCKEGIYFSRFYANSTRTDRALVAVLSGLPAQPTMSVMDQPRISTGLPSIARTLGRNGYDTHFYYGGDTNYSNMQSYLFGTGYKNITAQYDFSAAASTGKWGVADGKVFDRILSDIEKESATSGRPFFKTFMTSSSHEPFDVPDYDKLKDPSLNAFSYTDSCLGRFIEKLKTMPCWQNTLVVIVPDHLGAYPPHIDNYQLWRYEIPMVMLGGMISQPQTVSETGSQIDISATLLGMLGLPHDDFIYSKDLFDPQTPRYAFFSFPDAVGMVDAQGRHIVYDNTSKHTYGASGAGGDTLVGQAKAMLQKLYDDLGSR